MRVKLPLNWRTRNYVGSIFGGSLYGGVDPVYMIMLMKRLGPDYVVWDRSASIRFRKPGKTALYARFVLDDAEIEHLRALLAAQRSYDAFYVIALADAAGVVHAEVEKTIYLRCRDAAPEAGPD